MSDLINVPISSSVFTRLQRLAIPLVDDTSSVIEKLIGHWEANPPNISTSGVPAAAAPKVEFWRSPRGDILPLGASLKAEYLGKTFRATVEKKGIIFDGKVYDSPSPAGVAAKGQLGRTGRAASTDGRKFWKIQDPTSGRWVSIASLCPAQKIDTNALLAELANL
ncbi:MAG: hypothetical protein ACYC3A_01980 [Halothiobacillus sp.]